MAMCRQCSVRPSLEGLTQANTGMPVFLCQQCLEAEYGPGRTVSTQPVSAQEQLARKMLNYQESVQAQEEFNTKMNFIVYPIVIVIALIFVISLMS